MKNAKITEKGYAKEDAAEFEKEKKPERIRIVPGLRVINRAASSALYEIANPAPYDKICGAKIKR